MLAAGLLLLFLGLAASTLLAIASRAFYVWEDPKVLAITDVLPGANCGGCGYAGCSASAEAIAAGQAPADICVAGGFEVAKAVAEIMGQEVEEKEPEISSSSCIYGVDRADLIFNYNGATDCRAAMLLYGGSKLCAIGCIGLGSCVKACQFGALSIGDENLPVVNSELCVGCGACVEACPKNILTLTSTTRRIISEYRSDECTAPCQRTCPTGINIRGFIHQIRNGEYEAALTTIKEKCPLPSVCGYICPAPCEFECRRNLVDEGVAINPLKRFVADYEMITGNRVHPYKAPGKGLRVALVGGGSEGLTTAYILARLGYRPVIYESKSELGGILRYVISEDRLPRKVLDHDIQGILDIGVEAKTGMTMGEDFTVSSLLQEGHDAVVLTAGGFDSRKILNPEKSHYDVPVEGFFLLLDVLKSFARGEEIALGRHTALTYSDPDAIDLAHKFRKLGAEKVTIISSQSLSSMRLDSYDLERLQKEGIDVRASTIVSAMGGVSSRLTRVALETPDPSGQESPKMDFMDLDSMVVAEARLPELTFVRGEEAPEPPANKITWQTIETFRTFPDSDCTGIFTSPEPGRVSDSSAVVRSILSGRRLARAIHQYFTEGAISPIPSLAREKDSIPMVTKIHAVSARERQRPPLVDVEGDIKKAWVYPKEMPGLDESAARLEAERCLQCGLICYNKDQ